MKKHFIFLCILTILLFSGCNTQQAPQGSVKLYYPKSQISYGTSDGAFSYELREDAGNSIEDLITLYLKGPLTEELISPFPEQVDLLHLQIQEQEAALVLSDSYASLSGLELSIANACLAKTVMGLTGAETVTISCESQALEGERVITITKNTLILYDESVGSASEDHASVEPTT